MVGSIKMTKSINLFYVISEAYVHTTYTVQFYVILSELHEYISHFNFKIYSYRGFSYILTCMMYEIG